MLRWGAALLVIGLVAVAGVAGYWVFLAPGPPLSPPAMVSIKKGDTIATIAGRLQHAGVVRSGLAWRLLGRASGQAQRLQPGDYLWHGGETPAEVLRHIVHGDYMVVIITIPEGLTVRQIGERMEHAGLGCAVAFELAARDSDLTRALGLQPLGAEGYLFPATYRFSPLATTDFIIGTMLARFYANLTSATEERAFALGLTMNQVVTLASIVEKEAHQAQERPLIAGVFYNRMRFHMPLQSDPTAQYGLEEVPAQTAAQAVHTPSAFNTYDFVGLPPGPIANPGWASIEAALYPALSNYLYFVARKDGTHIFSRSLAEHIRAIAQVSRHDVKSSGNLPAAASHGAARDGHQ